MSETWYCYLIKSTIKPNLSYNGSTNDPIRRLRQHNGEITGGAFRTKIGQPWEYYAILKGLPNHNNALSCEWRIRYPDNKRKKDKKYLGVKGRIVGLNEILKLEYWTKQCKDKNSNMNLELYILPEYAKLLDENLIDNSFRNNLQVIIVDNIQSIF